MEQTDGGGGALPRPVEVVDEGALPHALTFFLSAGQRRAVVRALRGVERDRTRALLRVLGLERGTGEGSDEG